MLAKIKKGIFWMLLIIGSFTIIDLNFFSVNNTVVYAAEWTAQDSDKPKDSADWLQWFMNTIQSLLKIMYVIMWPLLAIAWVSLDNSLIYWSIFHLDRPLFMFWNMMKNFANYAMWFVFVVSVLMYFFQKWENLKPLNVIKKLLMWWVLIQASWWMVWALVDLSTVATYWLWAMPLNVLKNDTTIWNQQLSFDVVKINLNDGSSVWNFKWSQFRTCWINEMCVPCITKTEEWWILKVDDKKTWELIKTTQEQNKDAKISTDKCSYVNKIVKTSCPDLNLKSWDAIQMCQAEDSKVITLSNIIEKWKWMTWPLYALYGSIINFGSIPMTANNKSVWAETMIVLMKCIIWLALMVPLATLAIVLIIRVVLLWVFIWFSPLVILAFVFDGFKFAKSLNEWKFWLKKIISLIFVPVSAVFAISLSLIFLSLLANSFWDNKPVKWEARTNMEKALDVKILSWCVSMPADWSLWTLCMKNKDKTYGMDPLLDFFSWMVMNLLGIWLMWAIVFAAMKTWSVTDSVVDWVHKFGKDLVKSAPIIPTPYWRMWVSWLWRVATWLQQRIPDAIVSKQVSDTMQPIVERFWQVIWQAKKEHDGEFQRYANKVEYKWGSESLIKEMQTAASRSWAKLSDYKELPAAVSAAMRKDWYSKTPTYTNVDEMYADPNFVSWADTHWVALDKLADMYSNVWNDMQKKQDDDKAKELLAKTIQTGFEGKHEVANSNMKFYKKSTMVAEFKWDQFVKWYFAWINPKNLSELEELKELVWKLGDSVVKNDLKVSIQENYVTKDNKKYKFEVKWGKDVEITEIPMKV